MENSIQKPWAVILSAPDHHAFSFGRILPGFPEGMALVKKSYSRNAEPMDLYYLDVFNHPIKAIAYFRVHQDPSRKYTQKEAIELFLRSFPHEKKNLERFLSPRSPKFTKQVKESAKVKSLSELPENLNPQLAS